MSLLGIDVGTSGCKSAAFSVDGECLATAYREYSTLYPREGWAELDSRDVVARVWETVGEVAARTAEDPITAVSFSSLGEAMTPVSAEREILGNSILMTDLRGGEYVDRLREDMGQEAFYAINPNILGPNYSLPKLLWLRDNDRETYDRSAKFFLWADLIAYLLGGEALASHSLANRTLLYDLSAEDWSSRLIEWSGLDAEKLPRPVHSGTIAGTVSDSIAAELGLSSGVKIVIGGHDQCCNALGAGIHEAGKAVCGLGTFQCITPVYDRVPEASEMLRNGLHIEHHVLPGLYVSFIFNQGGTLVRWFRDTFASADRRAVSKDVDIYDVLTAEMPEEPTRLLVLPHFEWTGPPHFIADSAGVIAGLRVNTSRAEILKAILEGISFYFVDSLKALAHMGVDLSELVATGGGARSDAWLQVQADVYGIPFVRPRITECSILGAAILAGIATGVYKNAAEGVAQFVERDRVFEPDARRHAIYRERHAKYAELYPSLKSVLARL